MTIVNIFLERDRALVGVDTEAKNIETGAVGQVNKLFPLVHVNAVFAVRGTLDFFWPVYCGMGCGAQSFDSLVDELSPARLNAHWGQYEASPAYAGEPDALQTLKNRQELHLVGWSRRARSMQAWCFARLGAEGFKRHAIPQYLVAPATHQAIEKLGAPDCPEAMYRIAMAQIAAVREIEPSGAAGGRLIIAQLFKETMTIAAFGDLLAPSIPEGSHLPEKEKAG